MAGDEDEDLADDNPIDWQRDRLTVDMPWERRVREYLGKFLFGPVRELEQMEKPENLVLVNGRPPASVFLNSSDMLKMVHLHRAETSRLTMYRQRIDATGTWAMTILAVLIIFMLKSPSMSHSFFLFVALLQMFFCTMEARRYSYYCLVRHRCRLIERGMYASVLVPDLAATDWKAPLRSTYLPTANLLSFTTSFLIRLRRVYLVTLLIIYSFWIFKLTRYLNDWTQMPWEAFGIVTAILSGLLTYIAFFFNPPRLDV